MRDLHIALGWFVVISNLLVGAWSLAAHWQSILRRRELWFGIAVAEVAIAVQVALGVAYQQSSGLEASGVHLFYGFVALTVVGIIYSYRQQLEPHRYLLYGGGSLFLAGLALRSVFNATQTAGL